MPTIVDTNVLVDFFSAESPWRSWCDTQIEQSRRLGAIVINPIIFAELAAGFPTMELLDAALDPTKFQREDLPWEAAFMAGKAYLGYRRSGGDRRSPLPDFYIGAHAAVRAYRLLTRDLGRYRTYFPSLEIIAPDTHP
ncbi:type II toxin-antitoxin system VapC family toxin [Mesorhizobium sp. BAC0120]|uniref:type II toxin-antitoxin system VapC family toxin n=1 Tax=Mesorhizobium sp. BAC0120 TaxID=3090670 RepID=UPI00298D5A34|nr:type II toxin-antitoxin system VapC family toxin [Mesorhizobium sp. BAC0120]MDW6021907.1 type II toxin-antitoxin system VapC family toxin [Mesorhizobium sp. BAC0120]